MRSAGSCERGEREQFEQHRRTEVRGIRGRVVMRRDFHDIAADDRASFQGAQSG